MSSAGGGFHAGGGGGGGGGGSAGAEGPEFEAPDWRVTCRAELTKRAQRYIGLAEHPGKSLVDGEMVLIIQSLVQDGKGEEDVETCDAILAEMARLPGESMTRACEPLHHAVAINLALDDVLREAVDTGDTFATRFKGIVARRAKQRPLADLAQFKVGVAGAV